MREREKKNWFGDDECIKNWMFYKASSFDIKEFFKNGTESSSSRIEKIFFLFVASCGIQNVSCNHVSFICAAFL
jgi:hypothetical protein